MNHTMISMHERFDTFDKYHGETLNEQEKRHHDLKENFKNDINGYIGAKVI